VSGQVGTVQAVGSIHIVKSDGTTDSVFDSVQTALNCLAFMSARNQYYLMASDDIMILNVSNVKLLVLETTLLNQKLMNSFTMCYIQGEVMGVHRNLSAMLNLVDALISAGYKRTSPNNFANNSDLQDALPNPEKPLIQIVDVNYCSVVSTSADGSKLSDNVQLLYA
jgi:hypothetical protein